MREPHGPVTGTRQLRARGSRAASTRPLRIPHQLAAARAVGNDASFSLPLKTPRTLASHPKTFLSPAGSHQGSFPRFPRKRPFRPEINESRRKRAHTPHGVEKTTLVQPTAGSRPFPRNWAAFPWRASPVASGGGSASSTTCTRCSRSRQRTLYRCGSQGSGPTARVAAPQVWGGARDLRPWPRGCCWSRSHTGDTEAVDGGHAGRPPWAAATEPCCRS